MKKLVVILALAALALVGCASETTNKTPQACLDALDAADEVFSINDEAFIIAGESVKAAAVGDVATLRRNTDKINNLSDEVAPQHHKYQRNSDACRGETTNT